MKLHGAPPNTATTAPGLRTTILVGIGVVLVLVATGNAGAQSRDAIENTDRAAKMIQESQLPEAVQELDRVLATDPDYWEAHYQRGRALALMGRMQEARDSLVLAVELNPGFAHGHYLAWLAALEVRDYATAWEQAVSAELAGTDMSEHFPKLLAVSNAPEDIVDRLGSPRVFMAPFDTDDIESSAELPFNRNPAAENNRISERPDAVQGSFRLQEAAPELLELHRQMRLAVQRAPYLGLTLEPRDATVFVKFTIDAIGERSPRQVAGLLEAVAVETGKARWQRQIVLRDISSIGAIVPEIERYIHEMEGEIRYRPAEQQP